MSLFEWCQWLQHTRFATAISESDWLFPIIEGGHILALPLSVGMIVILDLRLFFPKMTQWDSASGPPAGAKFCAGFSLLLWIGVIVCGRTMAYQF